MTRRLMITDHLRSSSASAGQAKNQSMFSTESKEKERCFPCFCMESAKNMKKYPDLELAKTKGVYYIPIKWNFTEAYNDRKLLIPVQEWFGMDAGNL